MDPVTRRRDAELARLTGRVAALESAVEDSRRLSQRLVDVVDVVTTVLVPAADPEDARLREALDHLARVLEDDGRAQRSR